MTNQNFTTTFSVDQTAEEIFKSIITFEDGGQKKSKAVPTH
jgi:hypothetical protein